MVRRVRALKAEPYTQKEAELAAGYTTDNGKKLTEEEMMETDDVAAETT